MAASFDEDGYRHMIEMLLARGYTVRSYDDCDPAARHLVLRHDLDVSLEAALAIAEIEAELNVKAHYFVLLRSDIYNPFSASAQKAIKELQALGHEIGLHLDASLYDDDPAALDDAAAWECAALEQALGAPVRYISFHRPATSLLGYPKALAGRRHAYEPRFFSEMGYCSDSRGAWHYGHPLEHAAVSSGRGLQLLTHPIWWTGVAATDPVSRLDGFRRERDAQLGHDLADNCTPYREALAERARKSEQQA